MRKETVCSPSDSVLLLPQTGFNLEAQIEVNKKAFEKAIDVSDFQKEIISKNKEDLLSFYWEYLKKEPILPIPLGFDNNGDIICPRYDNARLIDTVSAAERDGVVKSNIVKLNSLLYSSPDNSTYVFTSPPGWSGYSGISYPNSQTYFYQKKDDAIEAMTVVTSMTLEENKQLIKKLTGTDIGNRDREKDIVYTTGTLIALPNFSIDDLISEIESVTNQNLENIHTAAKNNPVIDQAITDILKNFELFVANNIFDMNGGSEQELKREMGKVVLQMQHVTAYGRLPKTVDDYEKSLQEVQEISGCNGGGYIETAFGPRQVEYDFSIWGICIAGGCSNPQQEKWLGPCKICEECDALIRSGKDIQPKVVDYVRNNRGDEEFSVALLPLAFVAFLAGLFSSN